MSLEEKSRLMTVETLRGLDDQMIPLPAGAANRIADSYRNIDTTHDDPTTSRSKQYSAGNQVRGRDIVNNIWRWP